MPAIILDCVRKGFGKTLALDGISACLPKARVIGIVGPDGAGKTTLMRLMAGLLHPDHGSLQVADCHTVTDAKKLSSRIGYLPQRAGLYEDLSVLENLRLYAALRGLPKDEEAEAFERFFQYTHLKPFAHRLAGALSGGMKQKLGLICALLGTPQVLLLDEPGVGIDPVSRQDLWHMVAALTQKGVTVIWATAYLEEAERCHDVLLLHQGKLIYAGAPHALTERLAGRTWHWQVPASHRRSLLKEVLAQKLASDAVIEGDALRLVAPQTDEPLAFFNVICQKTGRQDALYPVAPRFEDAFVDVLGGLLMTSSSMAKKTDALPHSEEIAIAACALTRTFGDFVAADRVSFEVRRGEIFGLLGPNGAGKSTTFKMLCGLLRPTSGSLHVLGVDFKKAPSLVKAQLGYMAQKFALYGLLSVHQNLMFSAGVYGLSFAQKKERVAEMIDIFALAPYLDHAPETLPLGIRQRLALACALMHRPSILFLDEPTSGACPLTRREFWMHINGLADKGVTVLVTTHFMEEAEYCDTLALMLDGIIIAKDTPQHLKKAVRLCEHQTPTMEEAFIRHITAHRALERKHHA